MKKIKLHPPEILDFKTFISIVNSIKILITFGQQFQKKTREFINILRVNYLQISQYFKRQKLDVELNCRGSFHLFIFVIIDEVRILFSFHNRVHLLHILHLFHIIKISFQSIVRVLRSQKVLPKTSSLLGEWLKLPLKSKKERKGPASSSRMHWHYPWQHSIEPCLKA